MPGQFGGPAGEFPAILFLPAKILRRLKNNQSFWLAFFLNQLFMIVPSNKTPPSLHTTPPRTPIPLSSCAFVHIIPQRDTTRNVRGTSVRQHKRKPLTCARIKTRCARILTRRSTAQTNPSLKRRSTAQTKPHQLLDMYAAIS